MKNFILILSIFLSVVVGIPAINFCEAENSNNIYIVTANSAVVFSEPDISSEKIEILKHKTEVIVEYENNEAKIYTTENLNFYKTETGYIICDLLTPNANYIVSIPNFNAKTNSLCKVFFNENNELIESNIELQKGEQLFLYEGFDKKKDFTAVSFLKNGQVVYGYLKTSSISPNGINPLIISCIFLILAVLGIVFALVFMKKKKVKLKKKLA